MKAYRAGTISEAVQNAIEAIPDRKHREVAAFLGISPATLSFGMDPSETRPGGLGIAYVDRLCDKWPEAAEQMALHFGARAGGTFQKIDSACPEQAPWQHVACLAKETSEAVAAMSQVEHGGCVHQTRRELLEAREAIDAAIHDLDARPVDLKRGKRA
ncbi:hypothetical protein [Salipiger abyssi]|uniref:Uncharacterized protein n=1 Tax=Salipiger abyssi TaxID=1250539 RepID=A0A1P8UUP4_9RHOB|nr:hypothetical protein [Salipiger abyssi]APZ53112.1 hypothetical protein Ga0080574_TMP2778 [Salipiger abyssi]